MARNGYFQVINQDGKAWLQVHKPEDGGEMVSVDDVVQYLDRISLEDCDLSAISQYLQNEDFDIPLRLTDSEVLPESEKCIIRVIDQGVRALARFYPATSGGPALTEDDIIGDLRLAGVRHGIHKKAIDHFLAHREYCRDYIIADATPPVQGYDAEITYFFDVNATAKPKLNEDGSVDFHQLGNIKIVTEGEKLATLKPANHGRAGISVLGAPLNPKKVKVRHLRFGRNIEISPDKCNLYSKVAGHVTLVDDMVMVSDIYRVPADVDSSTGDIDYKGTVEVAGNVNTGFKIKAEGDIIVNGVVEGAVLISGGNIVLKRGMQGMERGELKAAGNITAKFLENCKVVCEGGLRADAVLHSEVECREQIQVRGKKGLINGGSIKTYSGIHATSLGSTMGSSTKVEILSDIELVKQANQLKEDIEEREEKLHGIEKTVRTIKELRDSWQEITPEQIQFMKTAAMSKPILKKELRKMRREREDILARIEKNRNVCIKVEGTVYPGVNIMVKDATRIVKEEMSHCRLVREGADVQMKGL
ncbi:MAG: DUF342 domain-containing protein [Lachnospiraceae bacterium]|nr:DUF342 domain-containing protein [Lachnospiraceae bacterium]